MQDERPVTEPAALFGLRIPGRQQAKALRSCNCKDLLQSRASELDLSLEQSPLTFANASVGAVKPTSIPKSLDKAIIMRENGKPAALGRRFRSAITIEFPVGDLN